MKKGNLLKSRRTGEFATIVAEPWVKLFRDANDWEAASYGYDSGVAATAIKICYMKNGRTQVLKQSDVRRLFEIIQEDKNEN